MFKNRVLRHKVVFIRPENVRGVYGRAQLERSRSTAKRIRRTTAMLWKFVEADEEEWMRTVKNARTKIEYAI